MVKFTDYDAPILKPVKFYDLPEVSQYLKLRYQIFINELGRPIIG